MYAPTDAYLADRWVRTWSELGATPSADVLGQLTARYRERHRAYHTLQHLSECLAMRSRLGSACAAPAEVDLALFFHDAVYEPLASDNEAESAAWLDRVARAAGLHDDVRNRLSRLVMVTRHDGTPTTGDEGVLVDTDLAIVGAPSARFDEYDQQVREEYRNVPDFLYRRKRTQILQAFLDRNPIYVTLPFRAALEAQARRNLAGAIARLA